MGGIKSKGAGQQPGRAGRAGLRKPEARPGARGSARKIVRDIIDREKQRTGGMVDGQAMEALLDRATNLYPPGQVPTEAREEMISALKTESLDGDAERARDILSQAMDCRKKGKVELDDVKGMIRRGWDPEKGGMSGAAAKAIKFSGWADGDIMTKEAKQVMTSFVESFHMDMMANQATEARNKEIAQQLAQDKRDFQDFLVQDHKEHKRIDYGDFKEKLQDDRVDTSEWQTLMLWLQTGVKRNPMGN
jgi:hypothetical protein